MADDKKNPPAFEKVNCTELRFSRAEVRRIIIDHIHSMGLLGVPSDDDKFWIYFNNDENANHMNVRFTWE